MARRRVDLEIVYRLLLCLRERPMNVSELVGCSGSSASTVVRYCDLVVDLGLAEVVEESPRRERRLRLRRRGEEFILLYQRLLALFWGL